MAAISANSHLAKPNKFRIGEVGADLIEHTMEIQVISDDRYYDELENMPEHPCGIVVAYVCHNWKTGNHMELSSAGIWGFDYVHTPDSEIVDAAKEQFLQLYDEYSDWIIATDNDVTATRINRQ